MHPGILKIHEEIFNKLALNVIRAGLDVTSLTYPYCVYDLISENRWFDHQIDKIIYNDNGILKTSYSYPVQADYQYSYICSASPENLQAGLDGVSNLYDLFVYESTKIIANNNNIRYALISPLQENNIFRDNIGERQFTFDVRYYYVHSRILTDTTGIIESVNVTNLNGV